MIEMCPACGAVQKPGEQHVCRPEPAAAREQELAIELDLPHDRARSAAPAPISSAIGLAAHGREPVETAALVWRFMLADGREVIAELDPVTTIETVRVGERIASRSAPGGMPQGHAIRVGASTLDPADVEKPYRAGAAPGEGLLKIDPAMRTCALTIDGLTIRPSAQPAPLAVPPPRASAPRVSAFATAPPIEARPPSSSPVATIIAVVIVAALIGGAFAIGRTGMVALGGIGLLIALVGGLMLLVAAFSESMLWGLVCLLLPGATLIFVITHWERARRGAATWLLGAIFLFVSGAGGAYFAKRDGTYDASASKATAAASTAPRCPASDPPPPGFSRWCCTRGGWVSTYSKGCTTALKPDDDCDESSIDTSTVVGCSTLGGSDRRR